MSYCTQTDIENVFGAENVLKWADLNGNKDGNHIATRIDWAIDEADAEFEDRMRRTHYRIPLKDSDGNVPTDVTSVTARMAGIVLHDARGIEDDQAMTDVRTWVATFFAEVLSGKRKLNAVY